jgi:hypothetical protein
MGVIEMRIVGSLRKYHSRQNLDVERGTKGRDRAKLPSAS